MFPSNSRLQEIISGRTTVLDCRNIELSLVFIALESYFATNSVGIRVLAWEHGAGESFIATGKVDPNISKWTDVIVEDVPTIASC